MNQAQAQIDHCPQCGGDSIGPAGAGVLCDDCGWRSGKGRQQSEREAEAHAKLGELERELAHEMASSGDVISRIKAERDRLAAELAREKATCKEFMDKWQVEYHRTNEQTRKLLAAEQSLAVKTSELEWLRAALVDSDGSVVSLIEGLEGMDNLSSEWEIWANVHRNRIAKALAAPAAAEPPAANHSGDSAEKVAQQSDALNLDHNEARALHRIVRAMHDGECPRCHVLTSSEAMLKTQPGSHCCPHCGFAISVQESSAVLAIFGEFMERNLEVFEKWRVSRKTDDAAENAEPAERRFVCPKCGGTEHIVSLGGHDNFGRFFPETVRCGELLQAGCGWSGTWAEVDAAKGEQENPCLGILDHKWLDPVCVGGGCQSLVLARVSEELKAEVEWRSLGIKSRDAIIVRLKQQLAAANQAREAAEQRAEAAEGRESAMQSKLNDIEASRTVLKKSAEAAEAAAGAMRLLVERIAKATAETNTSDYPSLQEIKAALATDAGATLLAELERLRKFEHQVRKACEQVKDSDSIEFIHESLAALDQAAQQVEDGR